VLERDNRGIGVDDPAGANVVGSKRIYKLDVRGATDIAARELPSDGNLAAAVPPIVPVTKSPDVFIDLAANTQLPNGKQVEKWEGMTIGPPEERRAPDPDRQRQRLLGHPAGRGDHTVRRLCRLSGRQRPARYRQADDAGRRGGGPGARRLRPHPRRPARLSRLAE